MFCFGSTVMLIAACSGQQHILLATDTLVPHMVYCMHLTCAYGTLCGRVFIRDLSQACKVACVSLRPVFVAVPLSIALVH